MPKHTPPPALPATAARRLSETQFAALTAAEAEGWSVAVEAGDQVVTVRQGQPGRTLVLTLATPPPAGRQPTA